jgi:hypothetical protein
MRPEAINPLTYDEHREFAEEVQRTRARLAQLASVVAGIYGPQSRSTFAFRKLLEAMERMTSEMQAQAELDCHGLNAGELYR